MHKIQGFVLACTEKHEDGKLCDGALQILNEDGAAGVLVILDYKKAMKEAVEFGTNKIKRVELTIFDDVDNNIQAPALHKIEIKPFQFRPRFGDDDVLSA